MVLIDIETNRFTTGKGDQKRMKIVCLGDSLTFGYGISPEENWISLLNQKNKHEFINKGINGDTSGGMLSRFYQDVVSLKPNNVFIMGGVNDLIAGDGLQSVKANIMALTHNAYHNQIIPTLGIPPMGDVEKIRSDWRAFTDFNEVKRLLLEYREWIKTFSKTFGPKVVDLYQAYEDSENREESEEYYVDGLHPNRFGQTLMAKHIGLRYGI